MGTGMTRAAAPATAVQTTKNKTTTAGTTQAAVPASGGAPDAAMDAPKTGVLSSADTAVAESHRASAGMVENMSAAKRWASAGMVENVSTAVRWYDEWRWIRYEYMECRVGSGSTYGDTSGFSVYSAEQCADECDYTDWCYGFSVDWYGSDPWCFLLGNVYIDDCYYNQYYDTWVLD